MSEVESISDFGLWIVDFGIPPTSEEPQITQLKADLCRREMQAGIPHTSINDDLSARH
jgi:hypothetical protein